MKRKIPIIAILLLFAAGCQKDSLNPEIKAKIFPLAADFIQTRTVQAEKPLAAVSPSLSVQYVIKGQNVFVECIVTGISFRESDRATQKIGKMLVWVDGRQKQEADGAAFIIKGLTAGSHHVKLEVVNLKNEPYGISKEFTVTIPTI
ncbi:hypothetical protein ACQYAD_06180 [Neobacillus sp. SM06]|uniref:hypothetical protein n=1 Tax=Neobacillus sp. SM06 TaxID=3422492 RepID=UPI003D2E6F5F